MIVDSIEVIFGRINIFKVEFIDFWNIFSVWRNNVIFDDKVD